MYIVNDRTGEMHTPKKENHGLSKRTPLLKQMSSYLCKIVKTLMTPQKITIHVVCLGLSCADQYPERYKNSTFCKLLIDLLCVQINADELWDDGWKIEALRGPQKNSVCRCSSRR